MSATVFRNDGLGKAINVFVGPTIHRVDREHLHETGAELKPDIIRKYTDFTVAARTEYSTVIRMMVRDGRRNGQIIGAVMDDLRKYKSPVLIVSDRVDHCEFLAHELKNQGVKVALLLSKTSNKERKKAVQDMRDGKKKVLIATVALVGEGFDAPNLHALFLTTPIKLSLIHISEPTRPY